MIRRLTGGKNESLLGEDDISLAAFETTDDVEGGVSG
jgi:hypothetical protein